MANPRQVIIITDDNLIADDFKQFGASLPEPVEVAVVHAGPINNWCSHALEVLSKFAFLVRSGA